MSNIFSLFGGSPPDDLVVLLQVLGSLSLGHAIEEGLGVPVHHISAGRDAIEVAFGMPDLLGTKIMTDNMYVC